MAEGGNTIKVILLGESGVDFRFKNITVDNKSVKLQIVSK